MTPKQKEQKRLFHILGIICMMRCLLKYLAKHLNYTIDIDIQLQEVERCIRRAMKRL